jgi:hypothetical protein
MLNDTTAHAMETTTMYQSQGSEGATSFGCSTAAGQSTSDSTNTPAVTPAATATPRPMMLVTTTPRMPAKTTTGRATAQAGPT